MKEIRVLSPTAILGYGFPEESFNEGMRRKPHVIAVDAGSHLKDDRNTDAEQLYKDAERLANELKNGQKAQEDAREETVELPSKEKKSEEKKK